MAPVQVYTVQALVMLLLVADPNNLDSNCATTAFDTCQLSYTSFYTVCTMHCMPLLVLIFVLEYIFNDCFWLWHCAPAFSQDLLLLDFHHGWHVEDFQVQSEG